jgi:septal ring factor EnvC (AmiA/AmiB activator)
METYLDKLVNDIKKKDETFKYMQERLTTLENDIAEKDIVIKSMETHISNVAAEKYNISKRCAEQYNHIEMLQHDRESFQVELFRLSTENEMLRLRICELSM